MTSGYLLLKFLHVLVAILALGTSAGLGIVLEFFGDAPAHGVYVLRAISRIERVFVIPGYLLMPITGIWMAHGIWPLTTPWLLAAMALWAVGLVAQLGAEWALTRYIRVAEVHGPGTRETRSWSLACRAAGAAGGMAVVLTLYLMVAKPPLTFLVR